MDAGGSIDLETTESIKYKMGEQHRHIKQINNVPEAGLNKIGMQIPSELDPSAPPYSVWCPMCQGPISNNGAYQIVDLDR